MVNKWLKFKHVWQLPVDCLYCGGSVTGNLPLCGLCWQKLPVNEFSCQCCAEPLTKDNLQSVCGKCLKTTPNFDRVYSPYLYQPPVSTLITRFKFQADLGAGYLLANLLADYLQRHLTQLPGCIIPVPLHTSRLRKRGFNQSQELARIVGKQLSIPVLNDTCLRNRNTDCQSGLDEKQRKKNIRNAFSISSALAYRDVAIIDDVMTTGNTVNELAKVLRNAGAKTIQVWSVCRASNWRI